MERTAAEWPEPTTEEPTAETLAAWADEDRCQATDGCWLVHGIAECRHGHPSWLLVLGRIADDAGD